ncbi:MAG: MFS transporter [Methyloligellaceae bacterium]
MSVGESMSARYPVGKRIKDAFTMLGVLMVSLLLLIYVAYGEAKQNYEHFVGDKLSGQVRVVQNAMETTLRSGLPLRQFVGFKTLTDPIFSSDSTVESLVVYDPKGNIVFEAGDQAVIDQLVFPENAKNKTAPASISERVAINSKNNRKGKGDDYELNNENGHYRISVPLRNKFETVGYLAISMAETAVNTRVRTVFEPLLYGAPILAVCFALIIAMFGHAIARSKVPWAQLGFVLVFMTVSAGVIATLIALYSDGAQAKARALAGSLGQRLNDIVAFNINIDEIDGLDRMFGEYVKLNPDISAARLTVDGRIVMHTDKSRVGQMWTKSEGNYEYVEDLSPASSGRVVQVAVELPGYVVLGQIARNVKNFAALFIASVFLASLFFQLGGAVRQPARNELKGGSELDSDEENSSEWMLTYVKPVFFLGVLLEHLTYAFLPQFVEAAVHEAGVSASYASAPFVGFYLLFALTLIPAGRCAQHLGPKPLMYCGLLLAGSGLAMLSVYPDIWMIFAARCLSGIGQGMLFIGVQSYLLAAAPPGKKTQAAGIIVFGFQGGMISGMAVGSLLVGYMGTNGVFMLSAAIGLVASLYAMIAVPKLSGHSILETSAAPNVDLLSSLGKAFRSHHFVSTMVTIGVPAKAVLTGVVTFALPLLLAKGGYPQEDIGQIIMIYAISVVASNQFMSAHVDSVGDARSVLFQGALLSGVGLGLIALTGTFDTSTAAPFMATIILVTGVMLVGIAHGFINAPVITYIADSKLAEEIGTSTATATYRFLERIGHVAGPVVIGQLLIWTQFDWSAVGIVGAATVICALMFVALSSSRKPPSVDEPAISQNDIMRRLNSPGIAP